MLRQPGCLECPRGRTMAVFRDRQTETDPRSLPMDAKLIWAQQEKLPCIQF